MNYNIFVIRQLFLFLLFLSTPFFVFSQVENGVVDFNGIDFNKTGNVKLDGNWEFYWEEFILLGQENQSNTFIAVPGSWTNDKKFPAWGYASYKLKIKGLKKNSVYSLYISDMASNYDLYIDGELYSENGKVGTNREESIPEYLPKETSFTASASEIEIIIHISNYNYRLGGIWRSLYFGTDAGIRKYKTILLLIDILLLGVLLAVSLFHIGVFLFRREEKFELVFGLICVSLALRILSTGEEVLSIFFPNISWEILRKLEFLPFYISIPLFVILLSYLFPKDVSKRLNKIIYLFSLIFGILVIFFPIRLTNNMIPIFQVHLIVLFIYVLSIMAKILKNKRNNSVLFTISYSIFFLATINDILYANSIIYSGYLAPIGFMVFIIGQSLILTRKFTRSITQTEILSESRDKFKEDSITDALTCLNNSRFLFQQLDVEIKKHKDSDKPLSFLMMDVDNFKIFNDTYGHTQGDKVLRKVGCTIKKSARDGDIACRYGGEEFSLVLPNASLERGFEVAERIRKNFENADYEDKRFKGVTISIGVSVLRKCDTVSSIIERADDALYKAKNSGRNRVELQD